MSGNSVCYPDNTNDKKRRKTEQHKAAREPTFPGGHCPCVRELAFLKKGHSCFALFVCFAGFDWLMHSFGERAQKSLKSKAMA